MTHPTNGNVNGDAKEALDTLEYVWQWGLSIWEAFPLELRAFVLVIFTISILMQWVKKALLTDKTKRERVKLLWLASLPLGLSIAALGAYLPWEDIHGGYWAVIGLTAGATAMGVHYFTTKVISPLLRIIWDRILLAVRGR